MQNKDIGFTVRKLSNLIKRDIESSPSRIGVDTIKGVNGWAIRYFYENSDKDIFQKDFEERFSIRRSTASKILKTMEEKGYIKRISVESDARLKKIVLTDTAVELHIRITADIAAREKRLRQNVTEQELETFFKVMEKFTANLEDYND